MNLYTTLLFLPGFVIGLTVHEFAHAWSASLLGDDFARRQGRVSLNPFRHLTPLGTLAILLLPFGWGRPVPVNLYNFSHPRRDYLLTSLAGPLANLLLAAVCLGSMHFFLHPFRYEGWQQTAMRYGYDILLFATIINAMLAVLNLLPIPPLDGSKIWPCVLPHAKAAIQPKSGMFFAVVLGILLCTHALNPILERAVFLVMQLTPRSDVTLLSAYKYAGHLSLDGEQAESLFTAALAIDPRDDDVLSGRATARLRLKNYAAALNDITAAIAIRPLPDYVQLQMAIVRAMKETPEAPDPAGDPPDDEPEQSERSADSIRPPQ